MSIMNKGKNILEKLSNGERIIDYSNLFFEANNHLVASDYDFCKKFGTLYDLFLRLFSGPISAKKAAEEQNEMITEIEDLKNFILSEEKTIKEETTKGVIKKAKTKTQRKEYVKA